MKKSVSIITCITLSALIAIAGVLCLSRSTAKAENSQSFEIIDVTKTFPVTISQFKVSEEVITLQDLKFKDEDIPLERCEIYFAAHSAYDVTGDDFLNNMEYLQEISKYLQEEIGSNTAITLIFKLNMKSRFTTDM